LQPLTAQKKGFLFWIQWLPKKLRDSKKIPIAYIFFNISKNQNIFLKYCHFCFIFEESTWVGKLLVSLKRHIQK